MRAARYGGGLGYRGVSDSGYASMIVAQGILAEKVLKAFTAERRADLAKYKRGCIEIQRHADGINDDLESMKKGVSWDDIQQLESQFNERTVAVNELFKGLVEDYRQRMVKAGVTTSLGFNFYDLRGPAFLLYPVNVPFRNSLPRWGKQNAGYGTAVHWKGTTLSPGTSYAGAAEGKRVAYATPTETDYIATYKELGIERAVTFTAEFAGEGYTDNVADEHLRGLHEFWLQEEGLMLGGNSGSGTGNNGFALGTSNTPTGTAVATVGAGFTSGHYISAYVVELTMLGYPNNAQYGYQAVPTVTSGLTPSFTRTNADATTDTINGGTSHISAGSTPVQVTGGNLSVSFKVAAKAGAFAWAWFIDDEATNTSVLANALLGGITTVPSFVAATTPTGTQAGNATGLNADKSAQALDFDGLIAYAVNAGVFLNMSDLTLTSPVTGSTNNGKLNAGLAGVTGAPAVQEIDYDLLQQWNSFQSVADAIHASADAKRYITACLFKNSSATPAFRIEVSRDQQGNIMGGFTVSSYKSLYAMKATGKEEIPIMIHPMLPAGTILYDKEQNPWPHSRIPGVRGMFVQRDYYSIEWPITTRQWTFGTYGHEVLGHYIPGMLTVRTGIVGVA